MTRISNVQAIQLHDGRGNPTVEVSVSLDSGSSGRALVPSGASKGKNEALELRDDDPSWYRGRGVLRAVRNVEEIIAPALVGQDASSQAAVDQLLRDLDGTSSLSRLGSNAVLGVSLACARAAADEARQPLFCYLNPQATYELPVPQVSIIGGGLHADNPLEFQDFLVVPVGAQSFSQAVHMTWLVRRATGEILHEIGHPLLVGDGGGFAPPLRSNQLAVELVLRGIERAGFRPGEDVTLAIDVAANHIMNSGKYCVDGTPLSNEEMADLISDWSAKYPLTSIEDPLHEEDWETWRLLTSRIGDKVQLVGDDLFVTNPARLAWGIENKLANAILVKLNQIGTLTDTIAVLRMAQRAGYGTVVSIRSGETEDTFVSDLAVATRAGQIKLGSLARSSRVAKFNQLLRIERLLGNSAPYAGRRTSKT